MIGLEHYLGLSSIVFALGLMGMVINRSSLIGMLMCIELMLLAANFNFIAMDHYLGSLQGQVMVFIALAVAAAEAAVGLAIFIVLYRKHRSIETDRFSKLKG